MDKSADLDISVTKAPAILYRPARPEASLSVLETGRQTVRSMVVNRRLGVFAGVLVETGRGTLETAQGRRDIVAPALFWLTVGMRHSYGPLPGSAWDERWVLFAGRLADEFVATGLIVPSAPVVALRDALEMARLFGELVAEMRMNSELGAAAAAATLHRLVVRAALEGRMSETTGASGGADPVAVLRERAFTDLDLGVLAAELGMSPATLRRRFLAAAGVPPKVFQLRVRIDRAKELLATTDLGIGEIAARIGFADPFYFTRLFLKREGRTPTAFRHLFGRR